jgi:uncharacterized Fe-S cluster protein YjdI
MVGVASVVKVCPHFGMMVTGERYLFQIKKKLPVII